VCSCRLLGVRKVGGRKMVSAVAVAAALLAVDAVVVLGLLREEWAVRREARLIVTRRHLVEELAAIDREWNVCARRVLLFDLAQSA
jgi:hypothetical protein